MSSSKNFKKKEFKEVPGGHYDDYDFYILPEGGKFYSSLTS